MLSVVKCDVRSIMPVAVGILCTQEWHDRLSSTKFPIVFLSGQEGAVRVGVCEACPVGCRVPSCALAAGRYASAQVVDISFFRPPARCVWCFRGSLASYVLLVCGDCNLCVGS